jgi:hypothetical protein
LYSRRHEPNHARGEPGNQREDAGSHYVKLNDEATGEIVAAHGFKLGLRPIKAAA